MATIRLTSKRQATFPKQLCDELKIEPGDELAVNTRVIDGETVWVLRPRSVDWSWVGALSVPTNVSHEMEDVRASIAQRRKRRVR
jgi:bifunctional DNA-binding transcriptional regulator/antitoxin component of YhaV-PrlF toxin-antitoxin module